MRFARLRKAISKYLIMPIGQCMRKRYFPNNFNAKFLIFLYNKIFPFYSSLITVKRKHSEHISIIEDTNGPKFLTTIFRENHISSAFMKLLEKWLVLALEWAPKQRGYVFEPPPPQPPTSPVTKPKSVSFAENVSQPIANAPVHVLKLFTMLDDILAQKILTAFCLHTCQYLSYPIDGGTTLEALCGQIESQTGIPAAELRFTIDLENSDVTKVEPTTRPIHLYIPNHFDRPMVYVSRAAKTIEPRLEIPQTIQEILENPKQKLKLHIYKRFAYNAHWFIRMEQQKYMEMLRGFHTYALQLNHECIEHEPTVTRMLRLVYGLEGAANMYGKTIESVQTNFGSVNGELRKVYWSDQLAKLSGHIAKLTLASEKIQQRYRSALRRSQEAVKHRIFATIEQDYFNVRDFEKFFDSVRTKIAKKEPDDIKELVFRAYTCLKRRDQLLLDKEFVQWQR